MTPAIYRYFVRGGWVGPADEEPAVTWIAPPSPDSCAGM